MKNVSWAAAAERGSRSSRRRIPRCWMFPWSPSPGNVPVHFPFRNLAKKLVKVLVIHRMFSFLCLWTYLVQVTFWLFSYEIMKKRNINVSNSLEKLERFYSFHLRSVKSYLHSSGLILFFYTYLLRFSYNFMTYILWTNLWFF